MTTPFIREFSTKFKKYLTTTKRVIHRLRTSCERAKRTSSSTQDNTEIDSLLRDIDFHTSITPVCFKKLNQNLSKSTLQPVKESLPDTKMDKSQTHTMSIQLRTQTPVAYATGAAGPPHQVQKKQVTRGPPWNSMLDEQEFRRPKVRDKKTIPRRRGLSRYRDAAIATEEKILGTDTRRSAARTGSDGTLLELSACPDKYLNGKQTRKWTGTEEWRWRLSSTVSNKRQRKCRFSFVSSSPIPFALGDLRHPRERYLERVRRGEVDAQGGQITITNDKGRLEEDTERMVNEAERYDGTNREKSGSYYFNARSRGWKDHEKDRGRNTETHGRQVHRSCQVLR
ncbi:Heat shock cognate 71 kDa protein [Eufriesea mexicana]|uniref:Heat shock cognate 71 kDa protein n=1 Tax=Eufriesea mexicana TaxID=516756 RepID=A0A310SN53_9HYME|nr:Heat shock cognate 71 kDa protein [Eufriesea mexicana]